MINNTFSEKKILCSAFILLALAMFGSSFIAQATVANDPMRNLTRAQYVKNMYLGWNLGNTFDANTETGWGNPMTTQAMLDAVHAKGINTLRLCVTWSGHFGGSPTYTIVDAWISRVAAVANYALNDSMYVIINTHHDGWYNLSSTSATVQAEVVAIWTQIATYFKTYSDYVSFELFNEPNAGATNQYGGGSDANRTALAAYQTAAIAAIRATGGNNATRMIIVQGISASPIQASTATIPIPDVYTMVSTHTYDPVGFSLNGSGTWGSSSDSASIRTNLTNLMSWLATKGGVVVLGEWGNTAADQEASRIKHAFYYAQQVINHGGVPIWWDNGSFSGADGFGLLNRKASPPSWQFPTVVQALSDGAKSGVFPSIPNSIEPSNENKISLNGGLIVKAGSINYALLKASSVSLCLYNMQGKIVSNLVQSHQPAGKYEVKLPAKGISFGNYVLELKTGDNFITKRLSLFK